MQLAAVCRLETSDPCVRPAGRRQVQLVFGASGAHPQLLVPPAGGRPLHGGLGGLGARGRLPLVAGRGGRRSRHGRLLLAGWLL